MYLSACISENKTSINPTEIVQHSLNAYLNQLRVVVVEDYSSRKLKR